MGTEQFERVVRVVVAGDGEEGIDFGIQFDIDFSVKRDRSSEPNEAEIRIYNLARQSRNKFGKEFKRIWIEAGYIENSDVIFAGEIRETVSTRNGTDILTTIKAGDGDVAWFLASMNTTAPAETPKQIIKRIVASMPGVALGSIIGLDEYPALRRPYIMNGLARDMLNDLGRTYDSRWSIQNGVLEWVPNNQAGSTTRVALISSSSGMIGTPERTEKGLKVTCLLNPAIKPNSLIEVRSSYLDLDGQGERAQDSHEGGGFYRVNTVEFRGSSYGNDFYSILDASPVSGGIVEVEPTREQAIATSGNVDVQPRRSQNAPPSGGVAP